VSEPHAITEGDWLLNPGIFDLPQPGALLPVVPHGLRVKELQDRDIAPLMSLELAPAHHARAGAQHQRPGQDEPSIRVGEHRPPVLASLKGLHGPIASALVAGRLKAQRKFEKAVETRVDASSHAFVREDPIADVDCRADVAVIG
jgi:hypothetical protein